MSALPCKTTASRSGHGAAPCLGVLSAALYRVHGSGKSRKYVHEAAARHPSGVQQKHLQHGEKHLHRCECRCHSGATASTSTPEATTRYAVQRAKAGETLRCALCFNPEFESLNQLAEHLVGRRHNDLFPSKDATAPCPYCHSPFTKPDMLDHIRRGQCTQAGRAKIPAEHLRRVSQEQLDSDPRYTPIYEEETQLGRIVIRPMHLEHTFETALVITEAFLVDPDPPRFPWMLAELQRHATFYAEYPDPVTRQVVNFAQRPLDVQLEEVISSVEVDSQDMFSGPWSGPSQRKKKEATRRQIEQAWGIWTWLVAELVPNDPSLLPEGQDSLIAGATAMMFHDREASIAALRGVGDGVTTAALDYSLWLSNRPPADLPHDRVMFIWWTAVDARLRRQGIAGQLLRGCEAVGAAAGFWDFYIQASLRQRDRGSLLGSWLPREYTAAVQAYAKAGYKEYSAGEPNSLWNISKVDSSAVLMHKHF